MATVTLVLSMALHANLTSSPGLLCMSVCRGARDHQKEVCLTASEPRKIGSPHGQNKYLNPSFALKNHK